MSANGGGAGMNGSGGFEDGEDAEMGTSAESAEEKWSASLVAEFDEHK